MDETKIHPLVSESETNQNPRREKSSANGRISFSSIPYHRLTRFRRVAKAVGIFATRKKHISHLRETAKLQKLSPDVFTYSQKLSETFLEEWLDFPLENHFTLFNILFLPMRWLVWTSKNLIGLDPNDKSLRDRIASSINNLGTTAGLFLVIAVAALLQPPGSQSPDPPNQLYVDLFGIFMFTAGASYIGYIAFILTVFYPMLQSLRDDVLFDAYERYMKRWGGYELYLFNIGLHFMIFGLIMACVILYSEWAMFVCLGCAFLFYGSTIFFSRECFLALDPISAMHLGLSNDFADRHQAEKLSSYLLQKIPNNILNSRSSSPREASQHRPPPVIAAVSDLLMSRRKQEESEEKKAVTEETDKSTPVQEFTSQTTHSNSKSNSNSNSNSDRRKTNVRSLVTNSKTIINPKPSTNTKVKEMSAIPSLSSLEPPSIISVEEVTLPMDLYELFSQEGYLRQSLSTDNCERIYSQLYERGFTTTDQVLNYLNDLKQEPMGGGCQCALYLQYLQSVQTNHVHNIHRRISRGEEDELASVDDDNDNDRDDDHSMSSQVPKTCRCKRYDVLHHEFCSNRKSTCWLLAVEGILSRKDLSLEKINQLILFFKPFLK